MTRSSDPERESEEQLVSRARAGDARAFARLLDGHRDALFAFLARATGDPDEAEDLLQLTVIRAWTGLAGYEECGRLVAWLFTIARRALIDHQRSEARKSALSVPVDELASDLTTDPHARLIARDLEAKIVEELQRLPEMRRTVFLLRHHSAMTFREIAEILEIPLGTALSHMHHALRSLKTVLESNDVSIR